MKKKKKINKKRIYRFFAMVLPLCMLLAVLSRVIPDDSFRLDLSESSVGEKAIALTFDDGPTEYTAALLDGLSEYDVKVSFFVSGSKAEAYPETLKRAYDEGHLIGNHTYEHLNFLTSSSKEIENSIDKCNEIVSGITGVRPLFVRAPHGYTTFWQLKAFDTFFVKWSVDTNDWKGKDADYIYERIMDKASDGEIILLHDTSEATVEAVLRAIPELLEEGYELVRVDDLLTRNGDKLKMGVPYRKCEDEKGAVAF